MIYTLRYDNGTGWFEGPYIVEANSIDEAIDKAYLRWCVNMYGSDAVIDSETNPNIKQAEDKIYD